MSDIKILIVENEVLIAADISAKLKRAGYQITDEVDSADEAVKSFKEDKADIIIMDINLNGKADGIDAALRIKKLHPVMLIFLTDIDNPDVVKRASQVNPSAYLIKPFNERQVIASINQALFNEQHKGKAKLAEVDDQNEEDHYLVNDSLFIRVENKHFKKIGLKDLLYMEADGSYTYFYTTSGERHTYSKSMNHIYDKVGLPSFVRISRSHVVNIERVEEIKGNILVLNKKELQIGDKFYDDVLKCFRLIR